MLVEGVQASHIGLVCSLYVARVGLGHSHGLLHGGTALELLQLVENVAPVVAWLAHPLVEVVQGRVRHLQSFGRDGCHTPQVRLIALVLQNGFLTQLNSVLLLQLADERLQELLLGLHLHNLGLDLEGDPLLHPPFVHTVAADLCEELHVAH